MTQPTLINFINENGPNTGPEIVVKIQAVRNLAVLRIFTRCGL